MSTEMITSLPGVTTALPSDIIYAVQGFISPANPGTSVQETLQQVSSLFLSQTILTYPGDPNGFVAGVVYQFCWDSIDGILYICTTSGSDLTAIWTQVSASAASITPPSHGGTGVNNPTAHTLPIAEGASNYNFIGPLTNGQLLIGSTGIDPVATTITAGANVNIVNAAGGITISTTGTGGFSWSHVTGVSQAMSSMNGYIADNAGLVTFTLPAVSNYGDQINIVGRGVGGWKVTQAALQQIIVGGASDTLGVGGSIASTNQRDSIILICTNPNFEWTAQAYIGDITII